MSVTASVASTHARRFPEGSTEACEAIAFESPDSVQGHGALFAVALETHAVLQASLSSREIVGVAASDALGRSIADLLGPDVLPLLARASSAERVEAFDRCCALPSGDRVDVRVHRSDGVLVVELEPARADEELEIGELRRRLADLFRLPAAYDDPSAYLRRAVTSFRELTGYDRAVVFKFDEEANGEVIAESRDEAMASLLGLHFPSVDIPKRARDMFLRNPVRYVVDLEREPSPLVPPLNVRNGRPLDLSLTHLRSMAAHCRTYRRNMSMRASLVVPIVVAGALWGLISCHHRGARALSLALRELGALAGANVGQSVEILEARARDRAEAAAFRVTATLREANDLATLLAAFAREEGELRALMRAGGVALLIEGQAALGGTTPPLDAIRELTQRFGGAGELDAFRTNELARVVPALAHLQPIAAGVLATRLSRDRPEILLWFRPEQSGEVTWAGDPTAGLVTSAEGFSLSPRASFEAWREKLAGTSRPWQATDLVVADICSRELAHRVASILARRAAEAKAEFLANMSHEIRTPMTAILGFVDILEHDVDLVNDPERVADALRTVRTNGRHLLTVINDVLDMSKLDAGKLAVEQVRFDPASVVDEVLSLLRAQAAGKGLRLDVTYAGPIPAVVTSDPTRLRQILLNLVGNALKFTARGAVTMRVAFGHVGERPLLEVSVTDNGIGLTPEQRESLLAFDAFVQADASTTRKFGGTGLGLRISNTLAKMLGGGISITSTYGQGSTFTVTIDAGDLEGVALLTDADRAAARVDARARARAPATPADAVARSLAGMRILLAEDGEDNQRLISFHLKKAGAVVTIAGNGLLALERVVEAEAAGTTFDLVLMDMQMPELDGYTATARLRARGFAAPVIALTAHAMAEDREKCLAAGCDDYESKPIDKVTLLAKCAAWRATGRTAPRA